MATTEISSSFSLPDQTQRARLAYDGSCLIIKGIEVDGKLLDIKVWLKNERDEEIPPPEQWPVDVMREVARHAKEIFKQSVFPRFADKRLWYKNSSPPQYKLENMKTGDTTLDISRDDVKSHLAAIHELFFNTQARGTGPGSLVKATLEEPSDWLKGINLDGESVGGVGSDEAELVIDENSAGDDVSKAMVPTTPKSKRKKDMTGKGGADQPGSSSSDATPSALPKDLVKVLNQPLATSEVMLLPGYLKNLTYQQLHDYAKKRPRPSDGTDAEEAYAHFIALLQAPAKKDSDESGMFNWLKIMYDRTLEHYMSERDKRAVDFSGSGDLEYWKQTYPRITDPLQALAANDVLAFILVENQDIHPLASALIGEHPGAGYADA